MIILMPVGGVQLYVKGQNKRSCAFYHLLEGDRVFASQALFPALRDGVLLKLVVKVDVRGGGIVSAAQLFLCVMITMNFGRRC